MADFVYCFICGFNISEDRDFSDYNNIKPNTLRLYMCPCCGFHYSLDDGLYTLMDYRQIWISEGMPFGVDLVNPNWSIDVVITQLRNLEKCNFSIFSKESEAWGHILKEKNLDWTSDFDENTVKKAWFKY